MVQAEQADAVLVVGVFDGLPQRCILLVRGVRARRGGVAREGEARTNQSVAQRRLQLYSKRIALQDPKKEFSLPWSHSAALNSRGGVGLGLVVSSHR